VKSVDELPQAARRQAQKPLEPVEIADIDQAADVPLDVGLDVIRQPDFRGDLAVVDPRIEAGSDDVPQVGVGAGGGEESVGIAGLSLRTAVQLGQRERQKVKDADTAGQRLGDFAHQKKILRAGEYETAWRGVAIDGGLET
jgi:hypothetical protein